jgi:hypothetical protein
VYVLLCCVDHYDRIVLTHAPPTPDLETPLLDIDIYSTHENTAEARKTNGPIRVKFGPGCTWKAKTIFPLKRVQLYDRKVWGPNNATKYLSQLYGPRFMEPPDQRLRSGHGGYADACKPEWQK